MHFVDRNNFANPPLDLLQSYHAKEQRKWLAYKACLVDKSLPKVNKPSGKWTNDNIRIPLIELFKHNCGYCGVYTQKDNDGEVDHFLPKDLDSRAEFIYSWGNYIWACHPCNNRKLNNYPLINPCDINEVSELYFHASTGQYLIKSNARVELKNKFNTTNLYTFLNGRNIPNRRQTKHTDINLYLEDIFQFERVHLILSQMDPDAEITLNVLTKIDERKKALKQCLKDCDFVLLVIDTFNKFKVKYPDFRYSYTDFI